MHFYSVQLVLVTAKTIGYNIKCLDQFHRHIINVYQCVEGVFQAE